MQISGLDEIEPRVILSVVACALTGGVAGAVPGALAIFMTEQPGQLAYLTLAAGLATGALVGAVASSTALLIAALRGRQHRHSSAGRRYKVEATPPSVHS